MFCLDYITEFDVSLYIFCQIHTIVPPNSSKLLLLKLHQVEQTKYLSVCHSSLLHTQFTRCYYTRSSTSGYLQHQKYTRGWKSASAFIVYVGKNANPAIKRHMDRNSSDSRCSPVDTSHDSYVSVFIPLIRAGWVMSIHIYIKHK